MEEKENKEKSQFKPGDKVIIRETPRTEELGIAKKSGIVERVNGEEIYVVYTEYFGLSGPYKLKTDEVEKVI